MCISCNADNKLNDFVRKIQLIMTLILSSVVKTMLLGKCYNLTYKLKFKRSVL